MKTISELMNNINNVNESVHKTVNLLIQSSGAMYDQMDDVKELINAYKSKKVNLYYYDPKGIHPLKDIDDLIPQGPHVADFDDIYKFTHKHAGELTLIWAT